MFRLTCFISLVFIVFLCSYSEAANKSASLIVNYKNGRIIHQDNAGALRNPASLVKMMTLYMAFTQLERGKLSLKQKLRVSKRAAAAPRTNLNLKAGQKISVYNAILGLIIHSANDAAIVLAEKISGSETKFAKHMTIKARRLGMKNTTFKNASGLHADGQKTTAYDLAKLAIALKRDFPQYFHLFTRSKFSYNGVVYRSHNRVTKNQQWSDGLKTGYTRASGFNLATTGRKGNVKLVGIVLGGKTAVARDNKMISLMNKCFDLVKKNDIRLARKARRQKNRVIMARRSVPVPAFKPRKFVQTNKSEMISVSNKVPKPILKPSNI